MCDGTAYNARKRSNLRTQLYVAGIKLGDNLILNVSLGEHASGEGNIAEALPTVLVRPRLGSARWRFLPNQTERSVALPVVPGISRIVANNPSLMTYHGTNTYLIETDEWLCRARSRPGR